MPIHYVKGDLFKTLKYCKEKPPIIIHICNDQKGWGKGFSGALGKKLPIAEQVYRRMSQSYKQILGKVFFCQDKRTKIYIANMVCQHGYKTEENPCPLDYQILHECLEQVLDYCLVFEIKEIHMPKIGTGLGGGDWEIIQELIIKSLNEFEVFVYELDTQ